MKRASLVMHSTGGRKSLRAESVSRDLASANEQIATVGKYKACGGALEV